MLFASPQVTESGLLVISFFFQYIIAYTQVQLLGLFALILLPQLSSLTGAI